MDANQQLVEAANALQILAGIIAAVVIIGNLKRPKVVLTALACFVLVVGVLGPQTWAQGMFDVVVAFLNDLFA